MKKIINTQSAPAPIGPYEQAILAGNTIYIGTNSCKSRNRRTCVGFVRRGDKTSYEESRADFERGGNVV